MFDFVDILLEFIIYSNSFFVEKLKLCNYMYVSNLLVGYVVHGCVFKFHDLIYFWFNKLQNFVFVIELGSWV